MNKILALIDLFRKGSAVANKEAWKKGQIGSTVIAGLILAIVQVAAVYGYPLPISEDVAMEIGAAFIGVVNFVLTYITTDKIGILAEKQEDAEGKQG